MSSRVLCAHCGNPGGRHKAGTDENGPAEQCPPGPYGRAPSFPLFPNVERADRSEQENQAQYAAVCATYWCDGRATTYRKERP